jgi:hypothetical protein
MALGLAAGASNFAAALPIQMYEQHRAALATTQSSESQSDQIARSEGIPPQSLPSVGHPNEGQPTGQGQGVRNANRNESNATAMNQGQQTNGGQHLTI